MTDIAAEVAVEPHGDVIYISQCLCQLAERVERGDKFEEKRLAQALRNWAQILTGSSILTPAELGKIVPTRTAQLPVTQNTQQQINLTQNSQQETNRKLDLVWLFLKILVTAPVILLMIFGVLAALILFIWFPFDFF